MVYIYILLTLVLLTYGLTSYLDNFLEDNTEKKSMALDIGTSLALSLILIGIRVGDRFWHENAWGLFTDWTSTLLMYGVGIFIAIQVLKKYKSKT